jgi:hypothetical protein
VGTLADVVAAIDQVSFHSVQATQITYWKKIKPATKIEYTKRIVDKIRDKFTISPLNRERKN